MLVELGQGWTLERRPGVVRLTKRGIVSWEWTAVRWLEILSQLDMPEPAPRDRRRVHIRREPDSPNARCGHFITPATLLEANPGALPCYGCIRGRKGR